MLLILIHLSSFITIYGWIYFVYLKFCCIHLIIKCPSQVGLSMLIYYQYPREYVFFFSQLTKLLLAFLTHTFQNVELKVVPTAKRIFALSYKFNRKLV